MTTRDHPLTLTRQCHDSIPSRPLLYRYVRGMDTIRVRQVDLSPFVSGLTEIRPTFFSPAQRRPASVDGIHPCRGCRTAEPQDAKTLINWPHVIYSASFLPFVTVLRRPGQWRLRGTITYRLLVQKM